MTSTPPTMAELRDICREHQIKGYSNKNKKQLKTVLFDKKLTCFQKNHSIILSSLISLLKVLPTSIAATTQTPTKPKAIIVP